MNVLSLFAGIGGLDLGLERAGMTVVGQVEIDDYCQRVLAKHWSEVPRHDDVRTCVQWWRSEPRPAVDVVAGGFPCQPVSSAGRQMAQADKRWLWPAMHFVNQSTGRVNVVPDNKVPQQSWRGCVRETVERHWTSPPIDGPVRVRCDFVMPRPLSTPKRRTPPAVKKPDGDKLLRAVWDALTHVVWVDDSRIVSWSGSKRLAELGETPGCRIRVAELTARVVQRPEAAEMAPMLDLGP